MALNQAKKKFYSGKGQFILKPINISEIVDEMTHLMEVSIEKSVVIKYHLADCYGHNPEAGRFIYVEISDTGCGMSKETIDKIFDPFFTTKDTGRGLGMSAVLGIVCGHKGALKVYSEPGRGTTFKFLLPVEKSEEAAGFDDEITPVQTYAGGTVLVVDDEETIREMGCMMLEEMGVDTPAAANGEDGLAQYKTDQASILFVLTDLTMPRMGGNELYSQFKKINPRCRVILTSGYNAQDAIQQFSGTGLAGFVQKPFTPATLSHEISKILGEEA